jgi:hypothetical protein
MGLRSAQKASEGLREGLSQRRPGWVSVSHTESRLVSKYATPCRAFHSPDLTSQSLGSDAIGDAPILERGFRPIYRPLPAQHSRRHETVACGLGADVQGWLQGFGSGLALCWAER